MKTFIDMFAGIGGFHLGLAEHGLECVWACESDSKAALCYEANFGLKPAGDVYDVDERDIPPHDVLCAGFPCQSFSIAGKRAGRQDERGMLYDEVLRVTKHHRPKIILMENVKNIRSIDKGAVIRDITEKFTGIGYEIRMCLLNSADFGIPQARERIYFALWRSDLDFDFSEPEAWAGGCGAQLQDYLVPDQMIPLNLFETRHKLTVIRHGPFDRSNRLIQMGYVYEGNMQGYRVYHPNGPARTQVANGGGAGAKTGLYLINGKIRRLHKDEVKAVMGFPQSHCVSEGSLGVKQLGNAVIPRMVSIVYNSIQKGLRPEDVI